MYAGGAFAFTVPGRHRLCRRPPTLGMVADGGLCMAVVAWPHTDWAAPLRTVASRTVLMAVAPQGRCRRPAVLSQAGEVPAPTSADPLHCRRRWALHGGGCLVPCQLDGVIAHRRRPRCADGGGVAGPPLATAWQLVWPARSSLRRRPPAHCMVADDGLCAACKMFCKFEMAYSYGVRDRKLK